MPDQPENNRTEQGQFAAGTSGNPKGRPAGAYSRSTQLARLLLARNAGKLVRKCISQALAGEAVALRLTIERLVPIPKTGSIRIDLQRITSLEDIPLALRTVIEAVASGALSLDDGERLAALIDRQRVAMEAPDIELRIRELESIVKEMHLAQMVDPRGVTRVNGHDAQSSTSAASATGGVERGPA
jgi:hypothetical protein